MPTTRDASMETRNSASKKALSKDADLATGFYDLGMSELVNETTNEEISQIWLCDDVSAAGEPEKLKQWLKLLTSEGKRYGYNLKRGKSYVLANDPKKLDAFKPEIESGKLKTADGTRYLGGPIGSKEFKTNFM